MEGIWHSTVSDLMCWLTRDFIFLTRVTLAGRPATRVRAGFNGLLFLRLFTSKNEKKGSAPNALHHGKEMQENGDHARGLSKIPLGDRDPGCCCL